MTVVGVFTQADVGDDDEADCRLPQSANGLRNDSIRVVTGAASCIFFRGNAEKDDGRYAEICNSTALFNEKVNGELVVTRHRSNGSPLALPRTHEQGHDEVISAQVRFPHHAAEQPALPQAARPSGSGWRDIAITRLSHVAKVPLKGDCASLDIARCGERLCESAITKRDLNERRGPVRNRRAGRPHPRCRPSSEPVDP